MMKKLIDSTTEHGSDVSWRRQDHSTNKSSRSNSSVLKISTALLMKWNGHIYSSI